MIIPFKINGKILELDVILTDYEFEEDVNAESYNIEISYIPKGITEQDIEHYVMTYYFNELHMEFSDKQYEKIKHKN